MISRVRAIFRRLLSTPIRTRTSRRRIHLRRQFAAERLEDRTLLTAFVVTTTADSGIGSLRQAILDANSHAGPDDITFNIGGGGAWTITPVTPLPGLHDSFTALDATTQPGYAGTPLIEINGQNLPLGQANIWVTGTNAEIYGLAVNRASYGIFLSPGSDHAIVSHNYIGTDRSGSLDLGNVYQGIFLQSNFNVISDNLISGNDANGVWIHGSGGSTGYQNVLQGNKIGTNAAGTSAIANGIHGVVLSHQARANYIGGDASGTAAGNLISGNGSIGVFIDQAGTNDNFVLNNKIGTNAAGTAAIPNATWGVIVGRGSNNIIGMDNPGDTHSNLISGNNQGGVAIIGGEASNNQVFNNFIGTDVTGLVDLGNAYSGVYTGEGGGFTLPFSSAAGIATDTQVIGNVISGNGDFGIWVADGTGSTIQGNTIGLGADGLTPIGNSRDGVYVTGANNIIGTDGDGVGDSAEGNLIGANGASGIWLNGSGASGNRVQGNIIGTDRSGTLRREHVYEGVAIVNGAHDNTIGTDGDGVADASEGNLIAGSNRWGVGIYAGAHSNVVAGNKIGTNLDGTTAIANGVGVFVASGAHSNRIGSNADGVSDDLEGNLISGNASYGVYFVDSTTRSNIVAGNRIGTDASGHYALGNGSDGVRIDTGASNNVIGGSSPASRNVISGNNGSGVFIQTATNNWIAGNYVGTTADGSSAMGNASSGIWLRLAASDNVIGTNGDGTADVAERNIISGNSGMGIRINLAGSDRNVVAGNFIGTDAAGTSAVPNSSHGVAITAGARWNRIGTNGDGLADTEERNVISGNANGVAMNGAIENTVAGNFIGTDVTGSVGIGNVIGVSIGGGSSENRVGTDGDGRFDEFEGNVISGNRGFGVQVTGTGSDRNVIAGNLIGTNADGTAAVGNLNHGVSIDTGARDNRVGTNGDGISDAAERNVVSGNNEGITIRTSHDNVVAGNFVGTDITGMIALGNRLSGIAVNTGATGNRIGTNADGVADHAERNVISGNSGQGVIVQGSHENRIAGNFIGTSSTGTVALGNAGSGVFLRAASSDNIVGTDGDGLGDAAERNVISGNGSMGIRIDDAGSDRNIVAGNLIGTNADGTVAIGNAIHGVGIHNGARDNRVGTNGDGVSDTDERNVISGNGADGVTITGAMENAVSGNFIGTDVTGLIGIGNQNSGVNIWGGSSRNLVGTNGDGVADVIERNVIAANSNGGVGITDFDVGGASENVVAGNFIGVGSDGVNALGNNLGVIIRGDVHSNRIGTNGDGLADADERNVISANSGSGVLIQAATNNVVAGNFIGTTADGAAALGNGDAGIWLRDAANDNIIGTDGDGTGDVAERNVISANDDFGVSIRGSAQNVVAGNFIGTDATGAIDLGNHLSGVEIYGGSAQNRIGTNGDGIADFAERNVISGNGESGIHIYDVGSDENVVAGNYIGTDVTGLLPLGNRFAGVGIFGGASSNRVGTDGDGLYDEAERNVIAASGPSDYGAGVIISDIVGPGASNNVIAGNYIGVGSDGTTPLGNSLSGVYINGDVSNNVIGSDDIGLVNPAEGNLIAFNLQAGVTVSFASWSGQTVGPAGTTIRGNIIHSNAKLGIDLANPGPVTDGVTPNDVGDADTGPNDLQNFPVLTLVEAGPTTHVVGSLNSTPNSTFTIDVYANSTADTSGYGEGERLLGTFTVTTDALGNVSFDEVMAASMAPGEAVTSIVTDAAGNTSEFSQVVYPAAHVTGVQINGSDALNRSDVNELTYLFDQNVTVTGLTALTLLNLTTGQTVDLSAATLVNNGTAAVTWDLSMVNLADGEYRAVLKASATNPGLAATSTFVFHKLAGDFDGDGTVGPSDRNIWFDPTQVVFGTRTGQEGYSTLFDFDGDGIISSRDYYYWARFLYGNSLP